MAVTIGWNASGLAICFIDDIPDEHYAKDHPGAGWAGYTHQKYGGYLERLSENK